MIGSMDERVGRIVFDGIYDAIVAIVPRQVTMFFLFTEIERLSWLTVTLQSKKCKVLWFVYSTMNLILKI